MLANALAAALDVPPRLVSGFADPAVNGLLGLDPASEGALALLALGPPGTPAGPAPPLPPISPATVLRDRPCPPHGGAAAHLMEYDRAAMVSGLDAGLMLDRQWHLLRGEMERTKEPTLLALGRILEEAGVAYAIIGGVAAQIHLPEPRTTVDVDLAVARADTIPRDRLEAAGFTLHDRSAHSENWRAPDSTPVQFTDDPALAGAISGAETIERGGVRLRVIRRVDLLHEKLRAGSDPARRRSKRLQDLSEAQGLLEADPALAAELTASERALLDRLPE